MTTAPVQADPQVASAPPRADSEARALLRILATQAENANPVVAIAAMVLVFTMYGRVQPAGLVIWSGLAVIVALSRYAISRRVRTSLRDAPERRLRGDLRLMVWGTAFNSCVMGSAYWLIAAHGDIYVRMIVTLVALVQMTAEMLYLMPRVEDRLLANIGNVAQGVMFWLGIASNEQPHWEILVVYSGMFWCGLIAGREQLRQFHESLRMRDENAALLVSLEAERSVVQAALEEARVANDSKSRFLAAASHDLRQPLHALTLFLGSLGFHVSGEEERRLLRRATDTLRVLEEQFNSLLDLSRFDAGAVAPSPRPFRLDETLRRIIDEFRPQAEAKGLTLTGSFEPAMANSDPLLMGRLLRNLLDNAVHYTVHGGVALHMRRVDAGFEIAVQDSGPGIAPEQQARIFDEYVQLDNPARQRKNGVGLGLAIVKRIDQLLSLRLRLQSALGVGSTFVVTVPEAEELPVVETSPAPADPLAFRIAARIWIVDDDPVVLEGLEEQLALWGADVSSFRAAEPVVDALQSGAPAPHWILTDDMLGNSMAGLQLAQQVARDHPGINLCVLTGNTEPVRMAELRDSGVTVIVKPASPERLIALLGEPREATAAV